MQYAVMKLLKMVKNVIVDMIHENVMKIVAIQGMLMNLNI